jgi:hypothetical protein
MFLSSMEAGSWLLTAQFLSFYCEIVVEIVDKAKIQGKSRLEDHGPKVRHGVVKT